MCLFACSYALLWIKDSLSFIISWIACVAIDLSIFMLISWTVDYMLSWVLDHLLLFLLVICLGTVSLDNVSLTQYQGIDFLCLFCVVFSAEKKNMWFNKWSKTLAVGSSSFVPSMMTITFWRRRNLRWGWWVSATIFWSFKDWIFIYHDCISLPSSATQVRASIPYFCVWYP